MIKNKLNIVLIIITTLFCNIVNASSIKCFSDGKLIYSGYPNKILKSPDFLYAIYKNHKDILLLDECIISEFKVVHKGAKK